MDLCLRAQTEAGLTDGELKAALTTLLSTRPAKRVLILPPDFTRYHSKAGFLTNVSYHYYADLGAEVDILPTLGTQLQKGDVVYFSVLGTSAKKLKHVLGLL